jgi:hypothetical protein
MLYSCDDAVSNKIIFKFVDKIILISKSRFPLGVIEEYYLALWRR